MDKKIKSFIKTDTIKQVNEKLINIFNSKKNIFNNKIKLIDWDYNNNGIKVLIGIKFFFSIDISVIKVIEEVYEGKFCYIFSDEYFKKNNKHFNNLNFLQVIFEYAEEYTMYYLSVNKPYDDNKIMQPTVMTKIIGKNEFDILCDIAPYYNIKDKEVYMYKGKKLLS